MAPKEDDFKQELEKAFFEAKGSSVEVNSGKLHRRVGGYPGSDRRMPICCRVMRAAMEPGDEIIKSPPKGDGASLTIRYVLPR